MSEVELVFNFVSRHWHRISRSLCNSGASQLELRLIRKPVLCSREGSSSSVHAKASFTQSAIALQGLDWKVQKNRIDGCCIGLRACWFGLVYVGRQSIKPADARGPSTRPSLGHSVSSW